MSDTLLSAPEVAERLLSSALPRRWNHVQAVALRAKEVGRRIHLMEIPVLVAAAWLHDIGYAPGVADTGLHGLDGARWLVQHGYDTRIAALVAYHSCASYEAEERGLASTLSAEFDEERSLVSDALWFSDMTTDPDGRDITVDARLAEISARYGPDDPVTKFWARARPELFEAVHRVELALES